MSDDDKLVVGKRYRIKYTGTDILQLELEDVGVFVRSYVDAWDQNVDVFRTDAGEIWLTEDNTLEVNEILAGS